MKGEYVKEGNAIKDKSYNDKKNELVVSIIKTKNDLENAINNYEFAEENLIDYFLYEIKANQTKLDYLLKKAKKSGIAMNLVESFSLKNMNII